MEMEPWLQTLLTILGTILASSGFWAYIQERSKRKAAENMLSALLPTEMRLLLKKNNRLVKVKPGLSFGLISISDKFSVGFGRKWCSIE